MVLNNAACVWPTACNSEALVVAGAASPRPRIVLTPPRCLRLPVQSPLCDAPTFVRQLEGTYAQLWQRWLDQQQQRRQE